MSNEFFFKKSLIIQQFFFAVLTFSLRRYMVSVARNSVWLFLLVKFWKKNVFFSGFFFIFFTGPSSFLFSSFCCDPAL